MAGDVLGGARTGGNGRYALVGVLRQSVFGRPAGYEDVNDADRLAHDRAMRAVVDRSGLDLPDGPLRDRTADLRGQPRGTDRSVPVRGSTGCTRVSRRTPSYSTWTAARVKPMARRRVTEVMVPRDLFADILALIAQLRAHPHQHEEFENDVRERTTGRGVSRWWKNSSFLPGYKATFHRLGTQVRRRSGCSLRHKPNARILMVPRSAIGGMSV